MHLKPEVGIGVTNVSNEEEPDSVAFQPGVCTYQTSFLPSKFRCRTQMGT